MDVATDPRAPRIAKIVQPDEIREKTGVRPLISCPAVLMALMLHAYSKAHFCWLLIMLVTTLCAQCRKNIAFAGLTYLHSSHCLGSGKLPAYTSFHSLMLGITRLLYALNEGR